MTVSFVGWLNLSIFISNLVLFIYEKSCVFVMSEEVVNLGASSSRKQTFDPTHEEDQDAIRELVNEDFIIDSDSDVDMNFESDASSAEEAVSESESDTSDVCENVWKNVVRADKKPKEYNFNKNAGPKLHNFVGTDPLHYFDLFFNDDLINIIAEETNRYAESKISDKQLGPQSVWKTWREVSPHEIRVFLGLIINMGLVSIPEIKDYWSSNWLTQIKFFGDIISRNRFLQIFWMLHVGNDASEESNRGIRRTRKIHGIIEHIERQFQKFFIPGRSVAIDESTIGFKGKVSFKTYNPKKPTKWGLRLFVLADSDTGYVHSIIPYYGKVTPDVCKLPYPDEPFTSRIVLSLMDRLGSVVGGIEGYHLFTDRYYSSVNLAQELYKRKCHTTGTIIAGRVGNPPEVKKGTLKKMKPGQTCAYRKGSTLVMGWKDKRVVIMVSTFHDTGMEKVKTIEKGNLHKEIMKPVCVLDYTKHMGATDRSDQYCATYSFIRKSLKWWTKLFFWCLEVSIVNSYILYTSHRSQAGERKMEHIRFRRAVVEALVGDVRNSRPRSHPGTADREERLNNKPHFIYNDKKNRKDCIVCSNRKVKGARRETKFYCKTCTLHPALCPGECFERYHTMRAFKNY